MSAKKKKSLLPPLLLRKLRTYPVFYQQVWLACSKIPLGETLTYGELARRINRPRAARAVGQALAKNPFAPLVPCHRVVRGDGKLGGYSAAGGVKAKAALLEKERLSRSRTGAPAKVAGRKNR